MSAEAIRVTNETSEKDRERIKTELSEKIFHSIPQKNFDELMNTLARAYDTDRSQTGRGSKARYVVSEVLSDLVEGSFLCRDDAEYIVALEEVLKIMPGCFDIEEEIKYARIKAHAAQRSGASVVYGISFVVSEAGVRSAKPLVTYRFDTNYVEEELFKYRRDIAKALLDSDVKKEGVQSEYDQAQHDYDMVSTKEAVLERAQRSADYYKEYLRLTDPELKVPLLDVGANTGDFVYYVREVLNNKQAVGVEPNVKSESRKEWLITGSCFELPFADQSFELVTSKNVLPIFVDKPDKIIMAIKEMVRVCKKGGRVVFDLIDTVDNLERAVAELETVSHESDDWRLQIEHYTGLIEIAKSLRSVLADLEMQLSVRIQQKDNIFTIQR